MTRFADFKASLTRRDTLTGFDPEIFVVDKAENKLIPAFEFLPPKTNPLVMVPGHTDLEAYGDSWPKNRYTEPRVKPGLYWDGFQAEFSTRPHSCHGWAMDMIQLGLRTLRTQARKFNPNARLTLQNVFEFTPEDLFQYPMEFVELGCDPSLNAYNRDPFRPENPFEVPVRMAGGHIHFAVENLEVEEAADIARYLDWLVGIPTVAMFEKYDNPKRREFYGRAGEFRLPPYGIEYRTLSNAWMGHPAVSNLVCDMGRYALSDKGFRKLISPEDFGFSFKDIQAVIDATDVAGARTLWDRSLGVWETMYARKYGQFFNFRYFDTAVRKGVDSIIPNYGEVEDNWELAHGAFHHSGGVLNKNTDWSRYCSNVLDYKPSLFDAKLQPAGVL